jgi:hypothetical protein
MKNNSAFLVVAISAFLLLPSVFAQLAMKLELNKQNYIQYEQIYARLIVRNQSGHPIVFGENENLKGKIRFEVETMCGEKVKVLSKPLYKIEDKLLKAGEQESFFIPLSKYFWFSGEGNYKIKATVSHVQIFDEYESNEVEFSIIHSNIIWSTKVGVPSVAEEGKKGKKIKDREYSIISYHDGKDKLYYLMVQDDGYIYGLARLGFDIGTRQPEHMIDRFSRLHILLQAGPDIYSYFIYDISCKLEGKAVYKRLEGSVIKLFEDESTERISVAGGIKASVGSDYIEETISDTSRMK